MIIMRGSAKMTMTKSSGIILPPSYNPKIIEVK